MKFGSKIRQLTAKSLMSLSLWWLVGSGGQTQLRLGFVQAELGV